MHAQLFVVCPAYVLPHHVFSSLLWVYGLWASFARSLSSRSMVILEIHEINLAENVYLARSSYPSFVTISFKVMSRVLHKPNH